MKITVFNIYTDETKTFSGEPSQVRNQLNAAYSFLGRYSHSSLQEDLTKLSQQQAYMVSLESE
jgi:hypothetical protein